VSASTSTFAMDGRLAHTASTCGIGGTFDPGALVVEEAQIVVHKAGWPDVISDFPDADGPATSVTGKGLKQPSVPVAGC
jgi:hypothetical protein